MSDGGVIASSGGKRNSLVFSLSEFQGTRTFDIRRYFVHKDTGDLIPTKKGITLSREPFDMLANVIEEHEDKIRQWLNSADETSAELEDFLSCEAEYSAAARLAPHPHLIKRSNWRSPQFFDVIAEGGKDHLVLNDRHPFVSGLMELLSRIQELAPGAAGTAATDATLELFASLLLSFARARRSYESGAHSLASVVFESAVLNWGLHLERALESEKDAPK